VRFRLEQRLSAPLEAVEEALFDPRFLARMGQLPDMGAPEVLDTHREDGVVHQRVRYAFTGKLPAAARRVVDPGRLIWVEESTHDPTTHRTGFRMLAVHYPKRLRCAGTGVLRPDGGGTCRTVTGELDVLVALVARRVEAAIVSGMEERAALQARLLERWLDEDGPRAG
jgi:hypothetical protein